MGKVDLDRLLNDLGVPDADSDTGAPNAAAPSASPAPTAPAALPTPATPTSTPPPSASAPSAPTNVRRTMLGIPIIDDQADANRVKLAKSLKPGIDNTSKLGKPAGGPNATGETVDLDVWNVGSWQDIYRPDADDAPTRGTEVRQALLAEGVVDAKTMNAAETIVRTTPGASLIAVLLQQGADEERMLRTVAHVSGLLFERIPLDNPEAFDVHSVQRLGAGFCKENCVLPLRNEGSRLVVATSNPDDVFVFDDVRLRLKARSLKLVVVPPSDIRHALDMLDDGGGSQEQDVEAILGDIEEDDVRVERASQDEVDLEKVAAESPVIRYVNYIIQNAVKEGASDIHIEPGDKTLKVRFRIDGVLFEMMQPPVKMAAAIVSRLKIMANLDISERRMPQDGRIRCTVQGRKLDLRLSTLPSTYGEKVVMRILDTRSINVGLEDLGFDENTLTIWRGQIEQPHGIILVTGPTGSGKTTTLYASLRHMDKKEQNISTVEDPVEYHLDGVTQTQVHEKIGMTFARVLKALLRQDPDVIMLGEIRDHETAHTAIQAALTGHLVLSTLHTNDAPSSITRLVNIGLEPFLIGAAINTALAQRLVRRICPHCKRHATVSDDHREFLEMHGIPTTELFEGAGCDKCRGRGFSGRVGIYELLVVDDHLRDVIARNPNVTEFRRMCCERGMVTLRQDGFSKVQKGQTTVGEILRVTESTI